VPAPPVPAAPRAGPPPAPFLSGTTLTINGTAANDIIQVTQNTTSLNVTINGTAYPAFALAAVKLVSVSAGDGNDVVILRNSTGTQAVTRRSIIDGGRGNDTLTGGSGNDQFVCGAANDGNDIMIGGPGDRDTVDYSRRSAGVNASLDGKANDGQLSAGERDNAGTDIEIILGGRGSDTLSGLGRDDIINGGLGADTIIGNDGSDYLVGSGGQDLVNGGAGSDYIIVTDGEPDRYYDGPAGGNEQVQRDFVGGMFIDVQLD
jgi:Ca2+-binding RTX toxin-like protein